MRLFADRYALERVVGQGATATVHLAKDTRTGTAVAVKMLRPELAQSGAAERFLREIARTSALSHSAILPVLDSGEFEGQLFFTLPYMEEGTLRQRLSKHTQLGIDETLAIVTQLAEALDHAHGQSVVHRDVKPENILFSSGRAHLGDFGIARALQTVYGDGSTSSATIRGTPAYMSPEQAAGSDNLDGRSDVFSLACVVYEMISGMQAFMGPTPESVVAQRFAYTPREIRVYRPTVSPAVESALNKAFALSPADRYQTAGEFAGALKTAHTTTSRSETTPAPKRRSRRTIWITAGVTAAVAFVAATLSGDGLRSLLGRDVALDTTRVVVLPFDGATGAEDMLAEGLQRYRGLSVVESFATTDAVRRSGDLTTLDQARVVARSLGAGRFVRGRVGVSGAESFAYAVLYDTRTNRELHHARLALLGEPVRMLAAYVALADSLVLRGATEGAPVGKSTVSLPASQTFVRARGALSEWNLPLAESLLVAALEFDPASARTNYWLAQVRSWKGMPVATWRDLSSRAVAAPSTLSLDDREHAVALAALASEDFDRACREYDALTTRHPSDFAAWYGVGECHRLDHIVVADPGSPSGWSFRRSYYRAMLAYQKAFEALPLSHIGVENNAYQPLQQLLFVIPRRLLPGNTQEIPRRDFLARAESRGDTIVFVPYPREAVLAGASLGDTAAARAATRAASSTFYRIATQWSAALPRNAGTKEALAVALEILGDLSGAVDTTRVARGLATDPSQRLRLASQEVVLAAKLGFSRGGSGMDRARVVADSVLTYAVPQNSRDALLLSRVGALLGRCGRVAELARRATGRDVNAEVPPAIYAGARAQLARVALECDPYATLPRLADQLKPAGAPESERLQREYDMIGPIVGVGFPENATVIRRLAKLTHDYVLVAAVSLLDGDTTAARRVLADALARRTGSGISFGPEAALSEARLWLSLHDTVTAIHLLDRAIETVAVAAPFSTADAAANLIYFGALPRIFVLRADLAHQRGQSAGHWAAPIASLWATADPELQATAVRMKSLAAS